MTDSVAKPVLSPERWATATTFAQYVAKMTVNRDTMLRYVDEVEIDPADIEWWKSQGKLNVLVLTFDGCGDALYNIPVMAKIAAQCPNIDLRVVQRDENLDIMDRYRNQGIYRSVPTFIFMDSYLVEIGNLKERPEQLSVIVEQEMIKVRRRLREENKVPWRAELARELRAVVAEHKRYP